jgi:ABC-type polysaccharide/polyol phosphate transport system ATPase subunit
MYSSGMQARLGFSVAIHIDADTLLLDEGLAVGDISFQEKCLNRLMQAKSDGKTIFLVSHDHHFVKRFADRAVWLDTGRVRMDGPGEFVVEAYEKEMLDQT